MIQIKVNAPNYSTPLNANQQILKRNNAEKQKNVSFGINILTGDEFRFKVVEKGLQKKVLKILRDALKKYKSDNRLFQIDKDYIKAIEPDKEKLGSHCEDFEMTGKSIKSAIDRSVINYKKTSEMPKYVEELNKSYGINLKYDPFQSYSISSGNYKELQRTIKTIAKTLSEMPNKERYSAILEANTSNSFALTINRGKDASSLGSIFAGEDFWMGKKEIQAEVKGLINDVDSEFIPPAELKKIKAKATKEAEKRERRLKKALEAFSLKMDELEKQNK